MNNPKQPTPLRSEDYDAIEETLMGSAQGRWFLTEFARRNRATDTQLVLDAISRLEALMRQLPNSTDLIRRDLIEMSETIARTRAEIAAIRPPRSQGDGSIAAAEELDAIVLATETATSEILTATEVIQEALWKLRGYEPLRPICDALQAKVTDIITACSFQDLTGQRIDKVVRVLRLLESRINSMIEIWGLDDYNLDAAQDTPASRETGRQDDTETLMQSDVDSMIESLEAFEPIEAGEKDIEMVDMPLPDAPLPADNNDDLCSSLRDTRSIAADETERRHQSAAARPREHQMTSHGANKTGDDLLAELRVEDLDRIKRDALFG